MRSVAFICWRRLASAAAMGILLFVTGCGSVPHVTGKVTHKGKNLTMGKIIFVSEDGKKKEFTSIGGDGVYKVIEPPIGKVKIGVEVTPPPPSPPIKGSPPVISSNKVEPVLIPAQYADPTKSGLTADIKAGSNTHDIDLK